MIRDTGTPGAPPGDGVPIVGGIDSIRSLSDLGTIVASLPPPQQMDLSPTGP